MSTNTTDEPMAVACTMLVRPSNHPKHAMNITYLYKCRRCGGIERNPHTGSSDGSTTQFTLDLINAMDDTPQKGRTQAPRSWSLHSCAPNACGVADLVGYEEE